MYNVHLLQSLSPPPLDLDGLVHALVDYPPDLCVMTGGHHPGASLQYSSIFYCFLVFISITTHVALYSTVVSHKTEKNVHDF